MSNYTVFIDESAEGREFARRFLAIHPEGFCPRQQPLPYIAFNDKQKEVGVCECGSIPFFTKKERKKEYTVKKIGGDRLTGLCLPAVLTEIAGDIHLISPFYALNLKELVKEVFRNRFSLQSSGDIMVKIIEALLFCDDNRMRYHDLKPSNLLVRFSDAPHVFPDGDYYKELRKYIDSESNGRIVSGYDVLITDWGDAIGTDFWGAPESFRKNLSPYSPVFSLGLILSFLLFRLSIRNAMSYFYAKTKTEVCWPDDAREFFSPIQGNGASPFEKGLYFLINHNDRIRDKSVSIDSNQKQKLVLLTKIIGEMTRFNPEARSMGNDYRSTLNLYKERVTGILG